MLDHTFTILWVLWGLAFAVVEGVALVNSKHGDTLSEHVWAWLGVGSNANPVKTPKWTLRVSRTILVSFLVWLLLHFTTKWV